MPDVKRETLKLSKLATIGKLLAAVVGVYLLAVLVKGLLEIKLAYSRLSEAKELLRVEEQKNLELRQKEVEISGADYIEKVARDKLNMQKEGETVVILPATQPGTDKITQTADGVGVPNWMKWWNLPSSDTEGFVASDGHKIYYTDPEPQWWWHDPAQDAGDATLIYWPGAGPANIPGGPALPIPNE